MQVTISLTGRQRLILVILLLVPLLLLLFWWTNAAEHAARESLAENEAASRREAQIWNEIKREEQRDKRVKAGRAPSAQQPAPTPPGQ